MTEAELERISQEVDRLINDPEVLMDPDRVWSLLDRVSAPEPETPPAAVIAQAATGLLSPPVATLA